METGLYRLELAVNDALNSLTGTNHFQSFLKTVFSLYSQPEPKESACRSCRWHALLRITAIFSIGLVASSFRAMRAVAQLRLSTGPLSKCVVRQCPLFHWTCKVWRSCETATDSFLHDLAIIMKDVLRELCCLSLKLQSRSCNLVTSYAEVDTLLWTLWRLLVVVNPQRKCWLSVQKHIQGVLLTAGKPGLNAGPVSHGGQVS